jgi:cobalt-zinc-cadmium efflux system outer membrane protein
MYTQAFVVGTLMLLCGASAHAQQNSWADTTTAIRLTRRQAVDEALAHNPQLEAARQQVAQARARVSEATALPDPSFSAAIADETGPVQFGTAGSKAMGIGVTIPFPTKIHLRGAVAGTDVSASEFSYTQSRQLIASQTVQAYDALLVAERHAQDLAEAKRLSDDFLQKTQARFNAGTAAKIDVIKAQVEVAQAENDLIANERDVANARAALNRLLGRVLGASVQMADTLTVPAAPPSLEMLEQHALVQRPEVRSMEAQRAGARMATSLAGQYWLPDLSIGVQRDFVRGIPTPYETDIGFSFPLFFWQHRSGEVAESQHHEMELAATSRDLEAQVSQEVESAHAAASTALRQVLYLRDQLLPEARDAYRIASTSYALGGSSALEVLDAQRTLLDAQSQYTDALGAANDARSQLELAVGAPLDSISTGDTHER